VGITNLHIPVETAIVEVAVKLDMAVGVAEGFEFRDAAPEVAVEGLPGFVVQTVDHPVKGDPAEAVGFQQAPQLKAGGLQLPVVADVVAAHRHKGDVGTGTAHRTVEGPIRHEVESENR